MLSYLRNLLKLARDDRRLHPNIAIYHVTAQCNLNCAYCEDFGARRNHRNDTWLPLEKAMQVLRVIRTGVNALFITGGEPFLHPDIDEIVARAKRDLNFSEVTLVSNGLLLPNHERTLQALDRLIISLDSLDPQNWSNIIGISPAQAESIHANIRAYAARQKEFGYRMIVNSVITSEMLKSPNFQTLNALVDFAIHNHLLISFSPQAVNNWIHYDLITSPEYKSIIERIIELKQRGAPILGSVAYFNSVRELQPYNCYPALAPRIMPNGDLTYPCRPFEKADNGQGGRPVNLLNVKSWNEAWDIAYKTYGQPPRSCHSCFQQCYAEPSFMQARPLQYLIERTAFSKQADLKTYAPG